MHKLFLLLLTVIFVQSSFAQVTYNPEPDPSAVVTSGKARFTVLTPEMIRIQYSNTSDFETRATFSVVNRNLPVPEFTTSEDDTYLYIKTSALTLRYRKGSRINPGSKSPTNLQITMSMNGTDEIWYPGKDDALNLKGTLRTLDNVAGDTSRGSLENGIVSRSGWSIIDESPSATRGDGSKSYAFEPQTDDYDWVAPQVDTSSTAVDLYFLGYGHDYKKALADFTKIGGKIPLPPKYMFGYWYSRYMAYTSSQFMQLVRDMENNDIPVDVMIMDMDWHKSGWTGWSWNTSLIPNPTSLITYMHKHGLKVALNLHPADGVGTYEDQYQTMKNDLGDKATLAQDGAIIWTVENRDFTKALFKDVIRPLEGNGVDFWWIDWQQQKTVGLHARERGYTCPSGLEDLGETFWCNHTFFNDMVQNRTDRRPVIYHRWGGLGSHRYQIGFSGDTYPTWATLQWQPYFTSTASNVGYDYWGHDLGGHQYSEDCNDPERYLRWMQFGVFSPIFRTHATNDSRIERRIWKFDNFAQLRETVVLRYALFPYIYTAARQTYDTGVGICRPLYYDYPEANNAYRYEDEYMFGDNILVSPVTTAAGSDNLSTRTTWLPQGTWWDVARNRLVKGDVTFTEKYTLEEIPYFFKAGSVIVNYPYQRTVQTTPDTIILKVAPGGNGSGEFYEDNGDNNDYDGNFARTMFENTATENSATLTIGGREGSFDEMPTTRTYQVEFLGAQSAPTSVSIGGKTASDETYSYDAEKGVITVNVPMADLAVGTTIKVDARFASATTLNETYNQQLATTETSPKLWITGSAVPAGTQPLENFPNGEYKFHGTLLPGEVYIIDTDGEKTGTNYYRPGSKYSNIINDGIKYTATTSKDEAAWKVSYQSDSYRFTVDTSAKTVTGENFIWPLELWIGGGCSAENQSDKWHSEYFVAMDNNQNDKNIWTWVGELKNIAGNVESNRFKLMAQKDWNPISFHPFAADEEATTSSQFRINGDDTKWTISKDGYYRIEVNTFLETLKVDYLGKTIPEGIELTKNPAVSIDAIYNMNGIRTDQFTKGVNIARDSYGHTKKIIK